MNRYTFLVATLFTGLCLKTNLVWGDQGKAGFSVPAAAATDLDFSRSTTPESPTLTPIYGITQYSGVISRNATNEYTAGLLAEIPVFQAVSAELGADFGKYKIEYQQASVAYSHPFNQYGMQANVKVPMFQSVIRPYAGLGLVGLYYDGMDQGPGTDKFGRWVGAGQAFVGAELVILKWVALGARAMFIQPFFNLPAVAGSSIGVSRGSEDALLMNSNLFRFLGTISISL